MKRGYFSNFFLIYMDGFIIIIIDIHPRLEMKYPFYLNITKKWIKHDWISYKLLCWKQNVIIMYTLSSSVTVNFDKNTETNSSFFFKIIAHLRTSEKKRRHFIIETFIIPIRLLSSFFADTIANRSFDQIIILSSLSALIICLQD